MKLLKLKILFFFLGCTILTSSAQEQHESKKFSYDKVAGIGHEAGITRRDPSDVIKVGDTYYVYYTKVYGHFSGYQKASIWCASSTDEGYSWEEQGEVLSVGDKGTFDSYSVFTPNVIYKDKQYYLYYTGVRPTPGHVDPLFENNSVNDYTAIGVAVSDSPVGPFYRKSKEPVLQVSTNQYAFDSYRIDDASLLYKDKKYWLYYKGRCMKDGINGPAGTKMGVAMSESPFGPFVKQAGPILAGSHEVMVWPGKKGMYALASITSTIEYAPDGIHFEENPLKLKVHNRPNAPGAYRPELTGKKSNDGLVWGISMVHNGNECYLVRYSYK